MSAELLNIYAPIPATKRGCPTMLGSSTKHNNILYACGRGIIIRNVENPLKADIYLEHSCQTTVAQYAPSGYYIASGDIQGNVRIWDTTQKEHPLKIELKILSGQVNDIAWSPDSQRILVVGDGKERFGAVFMWDAGSTVGEICGHSKQLNSGDFKPTRPYRVATGGEDMSVNWFEGPPFKFKKSIKDYQRFVNSVRFSPDGELFVVGSSDKSIMLYDGKTGDKICDFPAQHTGGVYALAWSPDSKTLLSVSADKTAVFWDVAERKPTNVVKFGTAAEQMQTGCVWINTTPITLSLEGNLHYLSPTAQAPVRVLHGHNKFVTAMFADSGKIFTASFDGRLIQWALDGANECFNGAGHTSQISKLCVLGDSLLSAGMDDSVKISSIAKREYTTSIGMDGPAIDIDASSKAGKVAVAVTRSTVYIVDNAKVVSKANYKFESTCCAISPDESVIAVGGKDKKVHFFSNTLAETGSIECIGELTCVRFSPNGKLLATADGSRNVFVWDVASKKKVVEGWQFHTAKINSIAWNADNTRIASGSLDGYFYVWNLSQPTVRISMMNANVGGVNAVAWIDGDTLATAGQDCSLKSWKIK